MIKDPVCGMNVDLDMLLLIAIKISSIFFRSQNALEALKQHPK